MTDQSAVLDLVQRWATAELTGDAEAYHWLLAPDFVGVGPVGFVLDATQWAQRHRSDLKNHEFDVNDPHVRLYGDTAVVEAVQKQQTTVMGRDTSGSFRLGIVVVKRDDRWLLAHVQLSGPLIAAGETPSFAR